MLQQIAIHMTKTWSMVFIHCSVADWGRKRSLEPKTENGVIYSGKYNFTLCCAANAAI